MKFPTGGTAHEPQGMIRCDSEADSTVWMEEDDGLQQESLLRILCMALEWCFPFRSVLFFRAVFERAPKCTKTALNVCVRGSFFQEADAHAG